MASTSSDSLIHSSQSDGRLRLSPSPSSSGTQSETMTMNPTSMTLATIAASAAAAAASADSSTLTAAAAAVADSVSVSVSESASVSASAAASPPSISFFPLSRSPLPSGSISSLGVSARAYGRLLDKLEFTPGMIQNLIAKARKTRNKRSIEEIQNAEAETDDQAETEENQKNDKKRTATEPPAAAAAESLPSLTQTKSQPPLPVPVQPSHSVFASPSPIHTRHSAHSHSVSQSQWEMNEYDKLVGRAKLGFQPIKPNTKFAIKHANNSSSSFTAIHPVNANATAAAANSTISTETISLGKFESTKSANFSPTKQRVDFIQTNNNNNVTTAAAKLFENYASGSPNQSQLLSSEFAAAHSPQPFNSPAAYSLLSLGLSGNNEIQIPPTIDGLNFAKDRAATLLRISLAINQQQQQLQNQTHSLPYSSSVAASVAADFDSLNLRQQLLSEVMQNHSLLANPDSHRLSLLAGLSTAQSQFINNSPYNNIIYSNPPINNNLQSQALFNNYQANNNNLHQPHHSLPLPHSSVNFPPSTAAASPSAAAASASAIGFHQLDRNQQMQYLIKHSQLQSQIIQQNQNPNPIHFQPNINNAMQLHPQPQQNSSIYSHPAALSMLQLQQIHSQSPNQFPPSNSSPFATNSLHNYSSFI